MSMLCLRQVQDRLEDLALGRLARAEVELPLHELQTRDRGRPDRRGRPRTTRRVQGRPGVGSSYRASRFHFSSPSTATRFTVCRGTVSVAPLAFTKTTCEQCSHALARRMVVNGAWG